MPDQPDEKRKFSRLSVLADVVYTKKIIGEREKLTFAKNIGQGGICLITYEEVKESDVLELKITLPDEKEAINILGKAVWVKKFSLGEVMGNERFDVGIEFIRISDIDRQKVDKYIFSHSPVK